MFVCFSYGESWLDPADVLAALLLQGQQMNGIKFWANKLLDLSMSRWQSVKPGVSCQHCSCTDLACNQLNVGSRVLRRPWQGWLLFQAIHISWIKALGKTMFYLQLFGNTVLATKCPPSISFYRPKMSVTDFFFVVRILYMLMCSKENISWFPEWRALVKPACILSGFHFMCQSLLTSCQLRLLWQRLFCVSDMKELFLACITCMGLFTHSPPPQTDVSREGFFFYNPVQRSVFCQPPQSLHTDLCWLVSSLIGWFLL